MREKNGRKFLVETGTETRGKMAEKIRFEKLTDRDRMEMTRIYHEQIKNRPRPENTGGPKISIRIIPGHYRRDDEGSC